MAGQIPGPLCQVRQWFADPVDPGTNARISTPVSRPIDKSSNHSVVKSSNNIVVAKIPAHHRAAIYRAVASGKAKGHQADTAQGKSKLDIHEARGHIASIYFATDQSTLDDDDKVVLREIYNTYAKFLTLSKVQMLFVGYADHRGSEKHNLRLGTKRANAVSDYFAPLRSSLNYSWGVSSAGGRAEVQTGHTSSELNPYRRVDIIASPALKKPAPPTKPKPPKQELKSYRWKMRLLGGGSAGGLGVGGSAFRLEIVDLDNHQRIEYDYVGGGLSAGYAGAASDSDWRNFETSIAIGIRDFQGPARHTSAGVQAYKGLSVDIIQLFGPTIHGAASVYEAWAGLWETGISLSAGSDVGRLANPKGPYDVVRGYN